MKAIGLKPIKATKECPYHTFMVGEDLWQGDFVKETAGIIKKCPYDEASFYVATPNLTKSGEKVQTCKI